MEDIKESISVEVHVLSIRILLLQLSGSFLLYCYFSMVSGVLLHCSINRVGYFMSYHSIVHSNHL